MTESVAPASSWRFWARYFWPRGAIGVGSLIAAVLISLAIPIYIGYGIDALLEADAQQAVPRLVLPIILLAVAQAGTRIVGITFLITVSRDAERDLRDATFGRLIRLDAGFHRKHPAGDIVSRLMNDLPGIVWMWSVGVLQAVGAGLFVLVSCIAMFVVAPKLALWAVLPVPFIVYGGQRFGKLIKSRAAETQKHLGALSASVQEDLAGIGVIRTYHLESARKELFAERSLTLRSLSLRATLASALFSPLLSAFTAASMFAVLWVGGTSVIDGEISIGVLVQFSALLGLMAIRVAWIGDTVAIFQRGMAGWSRIAPMLSYQPAIVDGRGSGFDGDVRGELEFRELTIELDGRRVLDKVSLRVPAGTSCAIVGRVGCGKSTLLEAIPRLIDVPAGAVFLDGRDITELPLKALRETVAYAAQAPFVFSSTIAENIAFGFQDSPDQADQDRVQRAADVAGLTPDLPVLPNGLATQVGERGITVSGGQRQRIALARTIASAKHRSVMVLDDTLSSVDAETERRILENLDRELAGSTLILVSHRVAAVKRAHQIAVLDHGRLVELGTHDELLARGGVYAELYRAQAEEDQKST